MESLAYEKKADDQLSKRRATTRPLDHDDLLTSHGAVGTGWKGGNPPPPDLVKSVNPISIGGPDYSITTCPDPLNFQTFLRPFDIANGKLKS